MPHTLSRSSYVHPDAVPVTDPDSDAVVYTYTDSHGRPHAQGFAGRSVRPMWSDRFVSDEARKGAIESFFARTREKRIEAAARRAERKRPHTLSVGGVLVASWGYEQTNVAFYEITRVVGPSTVEARPIKSARTYTAHQQGTCVPLPGRYTGTARRYRARVDNRIRISGFVTALPWDGTPCCWSAYA